MQHYRAGPWYDDADIVTGQSMHQQFQSLQAFWPGRLFFLCQALKPPHSLHGVTEPLLCIIA